MNQHLNFILLETSGASFVPLIIIIFLFTIPLIFFMITLQNTLKAISYENRKMKPKQVWLLLIPFFGLVWQFIIVNRIADSLKAEFASRGIKLDEKRPGFGIGLASCILSSCSIIPYLGYVTSFGGIICWIIYWSKINDYKIKLS